MASAKPKRTVAGFEERGMRDGFGKTEANGGWGMRGGFDKIEANGG